MIISRCKVNLGLEICGRRPDGYHELSTIFYPLDNPVDKIDFEKISTCALEIICDDQDIPIANNTLTKAWAAFAKFYPPKFGARVKLCKGIPKEAGLGGGSGDAAQFLLWLNQAHGFPLANKELHLAALAVGADVPFFLMARPCIARGVGEILQPIKLMAQGLYLLLICPAFGVQTAVAFKSFAQIKSGVHNENCLTKIIDKDKGNSLSNAALKECLKKHGIQNDLEAAVFPQYPKLAEIKSDILRLGALCASMSGSGSAIFGIFDDESIGRRAKETMRKKHARLYFSAMRNYC